MCAYGSQLQINIMLEHYSKVVSLYANSSTLRNHDQQFSIYNTPWTCVKRCRSDTIQLVVLLDGYVSQQIINQKYYQIEYILNESIGELKDECHNYEKKESKYIKMGVGIQFSKRMGIFKMVTQQSENQFSSFMPLFFEL